MCGGTTTWWIPRRQRPGLSPRVRGNQMLGLGILAIRGSIPACAGNRPNEECEDGRHGSIPACAGEPGCGWPVRGLNWVYPRVCGGTKSSQQEGRGAEGLSPRVRGTFLGTPGAGFAQGLSPRVRGNLPRILGIHRIVGSIPACAGEPTDSTSGCTMRRVYPRVCGGTTLSAVMRSVLSGLSPRVRGNPVFRLNCAIGSGSIPACAGEPP